MIQVGYLFYAVGKSMGSRGFTLTAVCRKRGDLDSAKSEVLAELTVIHIGIDTTPEGEEERQEMSPSLGTWVKC